MRKIDRRVVFASAIAIAVGFILALPARAQDASATTLYKSKCAACHGPDGTGSATGKTMGAHDFTSADVQKMSDAELISIITDGKNKMPAYGKSLKAEQIKGLVAYIHTLKK
ncbi:MAG: cytochrome c [Candidatus Acidiferrum sp.]